jgi:hypothetical protein
VEKTIVKKVRLTPKEAKQLTRLAKQLKTTESEVLRQGLRRQALVASRKKAHEQLVRWAEEETEDWKKPDIDVKW